MNFTDKEKLELYKYGFDGEGKIVIKGISGMGNQFETTGIIASFDGKMEIYDDLLIVDLSYNPAHLNGINERKNISAPFSTTIKDFVIKGIYNKKTENIENVKRTLYIKTIEDENGKVLYKNGDFEKVIIPIISDLKNERKEKLSKTFQYIDGYVDNVTAVIQKMTGKPVVIDGFSYVPSGIDEFDEFGRPVGVDASFKTNDCKIYVTEKSKISVLTNKENGKSKYFSEVANNDFTDVKDFFEENKKLIVNAKENESEKEM